MSNQYQRLDKVEKITGYRYPGIYLGEITKVDGTTVHIVEADHPDFRGMVHVFSAAQLSRRDESQLYKPIPSELEDIKVGQKWEHHKHGDLYEVVSLSLDEPTLEWLVTYKHSLNPALGWTRRASVFRDRFHRVSP